MLLFLKWTGIYVTEKLCTNDERVLAKKATDDEENNR